MNQDERRSYLIQALLRERGERSALPSSAAEQKRLLRALFNVRMPQKTDAAFLDVQDAYLRRAIAEKGVTTLGDLSSVARDIYIWQGDITTLECDAIVNAANSQMLGCFHPCHGCIDNAIPCSITHRHTTSFKASA